jgi:hypothetical protein
MSQYDTQITQAFQGVIRRAPAQSELDAYAAVMANGATIGQVIDNLVASPESVSAVRPLVRLYQAIFNRKPDTAGLDYWTGTYEAAAASAGYSKATLASVCAAWFGSTEYATAYPASLTTSQFVSAVYNNVFARAPDDAGLAYWVQQLDSEAITRQGMIVEFSESDEFKDRTDTPITTFQQNCGLGTETYTGSLI